MNKMITKAGTRPSGTSSLAAPAFARIRPHNRWASPRQVQMLESFWNARQRQAGQRLRPERAQSQHGQNDRLRHISETVGRSVANPRELTWREANRVLRRLLDEIRSGHIASAATPEAAPRRSSKKSRAKQSATLTAEAAESSAADKSAARQTKKSAPRRKPRHA